jgi:phosphate-selective porin OprO/OprP
MSASLRFVTALAVLLILTAPGRAATDEPSRAELKAMIRALSARVEALESGKATERSAQQEAVAAARKRDLELEETRKNVGEVKAFQAEQVKKEAKALFTVKPLGRINIDMWGVPESDAGINAFENPATGVDPEDRFELRRFRIGLQGDVRDSMFYKIEMEFNDPNSPTAKDAFIGWRNLPVLQTLILGHQKRPLALDALTSSKYIVMMERPLALDAFNEDQRRFGVLAAGDDVKHCGLNWRYGVFALENAQDDGRIVGDTHQMSVNGRVAATPVWRDGGREYLHLGLAGMHGNPDGQRNATDTNVNDGRFRTRGEVRSNNRWLDTLAIAGGDDFDTVGVELAYNRGPLSLTVESLQNWFSRIGDPTDLHFHGGYAMAAWWITGEHQPFDRKFGTLDRVYPKENFGMVRDHDGRVVHVNPGALQLALRYSHLDLTDRDIQGGIGNNWTLGLNWLFTAHTKMQFNYVFGDIHEHFVQRGQTAGEYESWGTRYAVDF